MIIVDGMLDIFEVTVDVMRTFGNVLQEGKRNFVANRCKPGKDPQRECPG